MNLKHYIHKLHQKENLSQLEIEDVMRQIMEGKALSEDIAAFLLSLREKGPSVEEITGAAKMMRQFATRIKSRRRKILDTCGTGGDKKNTFNISTITAFVVAGAGVTVAKHGNRSISSKCGSADLLESLGVNLQMEEKHIKECLDQVGIAFLFAQKLHPAMKNVAAIRRELGVETIFNILGPLTNPACATHQMMGVYKAEYVEPLAYVLKNLGLKKALVVHGSDGLDEITTTGKTYISEYNGKEILSYDISPEEIGISVALEKDLVGGDLVLNTKLANEILDGAKGPKRDIVLLNAAYAFYISDKVKRIEDGLSLAMQSIDKGMARQKLEELKEFTIRVR